MFLDAAVMGMDLLAFFLEQATMFQPSLQQVTGRVLLN